VVGVYRVESPYQQPHKLAAELFSSQDTVISCNAGVITYVGKIASIVYNDTINCNAGSIVYTGKAANVISSISCNAGVITYAGRPSSINVVINCNKGVILYTGKLASIGTRIACNLGQITYVGKTATLYRIIGSQYLDLSYYVVDYLLNIFDIKYNNRLINNFDISYNTDIRIISAFDIAYSSLNTIRNTFDIAYLGERLISTFDIVYESVDTIRNTFDIAYSLTNTIRNTFDISYSISGTNRLAFAFDIQYAYIDSNVTIIDSVPVLLVNGVAIELIDVELAMDEGGYVWEATCTFAYPQDYVNFKVNDSVVIIFLGETYNLIVDSKAIDRSDPSSVKVTLYGVSPAIQYNTPRVKAISKTWTDPVLASAIATELIPIINWEILDWVVPANAFGLQNTSPIDGVKNLSEAAGGLVESLPDGSIHVRYKHVVSVPDYDSVTAFSSISDNVDNFSYSEKYTPNKLANLLLITDKAADTTKDRVEFIPSEGDPTQGTLKVYPGVWRETLSIIPTAAIISTSYLGVVTRSETELIEFVDAKSSLNYPVVDITVIDWKDVNLGSINFNFYESAVSSTISTFAYSLANVTYETMSHDYYVVGVPNTSVQFVVEDA